MKGLVFTEFLTMVETGFGLATTDTVIEAAESKTKGGYTSVGTYDSIELIKMVEKLSRLVKQPRQLLIRAFGKHLHTIFLKKFRDFYSANDNTFDFLISVENLIHIEVKKLYPDAELPTFTFDSPSEDTLFVYYESKRPLADLAHGLIEATINHYSEDIEIKTVSSLNDDGKKRTFILTKWRNL